MNSSGFLAIGVGFLGIRVQKVPYTAAKNASNKDLAPALWGIGTYAPELRSIKLNLCLFRIGNCLETPMAILYRIRMILIPDWVNIKDERKNIPKLENLVKMENLSGILILQIMVGLKIIHCPINILMMKMKQEGLKQEILLEKRFLSGNMKKIKRIEICDKNKDSNVGLVKLSELLSKIEDGSLYKWGVLFFDALYYSSEAKPIANYINQNIQEKKIIPISWGEIKVLAKGIGQFIDLVLIGCKDSKKLKYYEDDDEMLRECDIVIINFDACWWEVSCKDETLMNKFIGSFKEVRIVTE